MNHGVSFPAHALLVRKAKRELSLRSLPRSVAAVKPGGSAARSMDNVVSAAFAVLQPAIGARGGVATLREVEALVERLRSSTTKAGATNQGCQAHLAP